MTKRIHFFQLLCMLIALAYSFFISLDLFIHHFKYTNEVFFAFGVLIILLAVIKYLLKLQMYVFVKKHEKTAQKVEKIAEKGQKRLFFYDFLVWIFMLAILAYQIFLFDVFHTISVALIVSLAFELLFYVVFFKQFKIMLHSGQLFVFTARPQTIGLKNIKTIEERYGDFYINYTNSKFALLKSDLFSDELKSKVKEFVFEPHY